MRKRNAHAGSRPHPLCPECGYDLVGTFAAGSRRCPECGCTFASGRPGADPHRWTPLVGARQAAWTLLWRAALATLLCAGLDWFLIPAMGSPPYWRVMLVLAMSGLALGWGLSADIAADAGFSGPYLALLVSAFAWAAVMGGVGLAALLRIVSAAITSGAGPAPDWGAVAVLHVTGVFATLWIIRATVLD